MFRFLYYFIGVVLYAAALPIVVLLPLFSKYKESIPARFFLYKNPPFRKKGVWFHACSLGEVKSLASLIDKIDEEINISVITNTGYEIAKNFKADRRYLPFEIFLPFWINSQKALVVTEAELWYMLFFIAKNKGAKTYLLNARISDNSYKKYLRFAWFYKRIFENIDTVFAQTQKDKKRLEELGAKNVKVTGNIKAHQDIKMTKKFKKPEKELITLASTHEGEESLLLKNLDFKNSVVAVVPRHPQRFEKVSKILENFSKKNSLSYHRFSQREEFDSDIVLVDKMGELINIYAVSDIVLLGGSFIDGIGGHNPLEAAFFGVKLISGKYIFNQEALFELVENAVVCDADEVVKYMKKSKATEIISKPDMKEILEEFSFVV